jgi:ketosteroid isomerase-like protein
MTVREAFEKGTETFNAHDFDGFAGVLAEDVEFRAPGGTGGKGKDSCAQFFASWLGAFPDAHVYGLTTCPIRRPQVPGAVLASRYASAPRGSRPGVAAEGT